MARRLILFPFALTLLLAASASGARDRHALAKQCEPAKQGCFQLESAIAFSSTRDHVNEGLNPPLLGAELYLIKPVMNPDGTWALTDPRRLTNNSSFDGFANLSPDGKKIVFDSSRLTAGSLCNGVASTLNISDLFLMDTDGSGQTLLTRGSSATWAPDGKEIAFHASASYYASGGLVSGCPIRTDPGSATSDSDIFVANVDDLLAGTERPRNITNTPDQIEDDPDWSNVPTTAPKGQTIVFTSHPSTDNTQDSSHAELYLMNPNGSNRLQLTHDDYEERAPAWSPDGTRIAYSCRVGPPNPMTGIKSFRICVINADGSNPPQQLTFESDSISDLTASWSPDGQHILFHRRVGLTPANQQLFVITQNTDGTWTTPTQLSFGTPTSPDGVNNLAHWGELRVASRP
jgi:Tol biopolymer transport system component